MVNVLPFDISIVRFLHTTINAMVLVLSKKKHSTDKNNEHTMFMRNACKEKGFKLALSRCILVTYQLIHSLLLGHSPSSLFVVT